MDFARELVDQAITGFAFLAERLKGAVSELTLDDQFLEAAPVGNLWFASGNGHRAMLLSVWTKANYANSPIFNPKR